MLTNRAGSALLALVLVMIGIAFAGAVALTPNVAQQKDRWRLDRTLDRLTWLTDSTTALVRFQTDVGNYPGALSHLSTAITNQDRDLCGATYGGSAGSWGGRYAGRLYSPTGTPLPLGLMADTLVYDATPGDLALVITLTGVREEQARQLDLHVDGAFGAAAGRVRYGAADAQGLVTLRWRKAIAQC